MVHFRKFMPALFLTVAALYGCSQSEEVVSGEPSSDNVTGVVFRLQSNASAMTRTAEDSYVYTQGSPDEYVVNNARVYLYDNVTKLFVRTAEIKNLTQDGSDADGNIIYKSEHIQVPQGTYDIFVTANTNRVITKEKESDFLAAIDSTSYVKGLIEDISAGVLMTNRATDNIGVPIINKENKADNVVTVKLERVLARIDIAKSAEKFELTDEKNVKYASVCIDGYRIVNNPKYFFNYRHTAVLTTIAEPTWSLNANFGNVNDVNGYVIDPYFFKKQIDASTFTNADKYYENYFGDLKPATQTSWTSFNAVSQTPNYKTAYCLENCMLAAAQKNGYSTGVVFRALVEPNNNIYRLNGEGKLELTTTQPETLYYYNHKFYDSADALAAGIGTTTTDINQFDTKKFEKTDDGYRIYYTYWIRHLDNNKPTEMGVMEFGIVRNNLYRLMITGVSDFGFTGTDPGDPEPDTPDEGETHLKVILNVKPWIVRDQTNIVL